MLRKCACPTHHWRDCGGGHNNMTEMATPLPDYRTPVGGEGQSSQGLDGAHLKPCLHYSDFQSVFSRPQKKSASSGKLLERHTVGYHPEVRPSKWWVYYYYYLSIYLVVLGLSCGMQDLPCIMWDFSDEPSKKFRGWLQFENLCSRVYIQEEVIHQRSCRWCCRWLVRGGGGRGGCGEACFLN